MQVWYQSISLLCNLNTIQKLKIKIVGSNISTVHVQRYDKPYGICYHRIVPIFFEQKIINVIANKYNLLCCNYILHAYKVFFFKSI